MTSAKSHLILLVQLSVVIGEFASSSLIAESTSSYKTCEKTFSAEKFTITLPKKERPEPFECRFSVSAFTPDVCRLVVNFRQFVLNSSPSCRDQFFRVGGRRLCGSILGAQTVPFPDSTMTIHYRGDGEHPLEVEVEQIRCKIQATPNSCDVTSSETETEIRSPNYPNEYPTPLTCLYTILARPQETCQLFIRFLDFELPDSPDCQKGRVVIDGKSYCGKKTGWTVDVNVSNEYKFEFSAGTGQGSRGFRISVNQISCKKLYELPTNVSANQLDYLPPSPFPPQCCNRIFNSAFFTITSPGFLELGTPSDFNCVYQLAPASPSFCRIRLNFLHFWLGQEDVHYGCIDSFLEIDGRRICGCKDGLTIDSYFSGERKDLWLNMRGLRSKGFIIEVTQIDCNGFNGRNTPEETTMRSPDNEVEVFSINSTLDKVKSRLFVPSDDSRCYQWGLPHWLDKVRGILQSIPDKCPAPLSGLHHPSSCSPPSINPIVPPSYPYPPPAVPPISPPQYPPSTPPIIPPPNFPIPPISPPQYPPATPPIIPPPNFPLPPITPPQYPPSIPPIIPPPQPPIILPPPSPPIISPYPPIINPPPLQPLPPIIPPPLPQPPISPPQYPIRPLPPIYPLPGRCQVFASLQGGFQSPGYPWNYPPNQKCCYRIRQAPGFCRLQLTVLDFDLCWSPKCLKDYLLLDQTTRYCSRALQSSVSYLPFRNGVASIDFVSDIFLSSRGFRVVFRQIPCYLTQNSPRSDEGLKRYLPPSVKPVQTLAPRSTPATTLKYDDRDLVLNVTPVR